jgi:GNAT superfamily N-acetyltransferase
MVETVPPPADPLPPSLENYLHFLRLFRGQVTSDSAGVLVESDRREFTMKIPLAMQSAQHLRGFPGSILSVPWIPTSAVLSEGLFRREAEIVFLRKPASAASFNGAATIRAAATPEDIEVFSLVQGRGFLEDEQDFRDWHPWLGAANLRNLGHRDCRFLIAERDGQPAAVALLVESPRACGIYAVATPPDQRKRGLSAALLAAAEEWARERGYGSVCLQVYAGTYAHGFYERRGFTEEYRLGVWSEIGADRAD